MITIKSKHFHLYGLFALALFFLVGCSNEKRYELRATGASSSLSGEVSVSEDNLGNITLDIEVELLDNQSPTDTRKYYVAWAKSEGDTERLGLLNVDDRRGELIATTEMDSFTVMITSEKSRDVSRPYDATILESQAITVE